MPANGSPTTTRNKLVVFIGIAVSSCLLHVMMMTQEVTDIFDHMHLYRVQLAMAGIVISTTVGLLHILHRFRNKLYITLNKCTNCLASLRPLYGKSLAVIVGFSRSVYKMEFPSKKGEFLMLLCGGLYGLMSSRFYASLK